MGKLWDQTLLLACWTINWKCVPFGVDLLVSCSAVGKPVLGDMGTLSRLVVSDMLPMKGSVGGTVGPDPSC